MVDRIVQVGGSNSLFSAKEDPNNGSPTTGIPVILKVTDEDLLAYLQSGALQVITTQGAEGYISPLNSTEVNLLANDTFEGVYDSALNYGGIRILVYSSHVSATGGLQLWCSKDGVSGFQDDAYTIAATTPKTYAVPIAPYFKIRYVNGPTGTTTLKICTLFLKNTSVVSSHRIGDVVTDEDDAQLVKSVLSARKPNGLQTNIDATAGGNLKVSVEEIDPSASMAITSDDLAAINIINNTIFDDILISYTDATKTVISKIEWKLGGVVIRTLTPTFGATTDRWLKS